MRARRRGAGPRAARGRAARRWELYVDLAGVEERSCCPPPTRSRPRCGTTAGLLAANFAVDRRARSCSGSRWRSRVGFALAVAIHLFPLAAPRRVSARGRLAGGADPGDRRAAGVLVGLRDLPQARRDRADLLLPGGRHHRRRPGRRRPRAAQAAAHARRLALAGVSLRRAAGGAAGRAQRRADRAGGRRDRRVHRRDAAPPSTAAYAGLGREIITDAGGFQTPRAYAATAVLFVFAIACFYALALAERRLVPWKHSTRRETLNTSQPTPLPHVRPTTRAAPTVATRPGRTAEHVRAHSRRLLRPAQRWRWRAWLALSWRVRRQAGRDLAARAPSRSR